MNNSGSSEAKIRTLNGGVIDLTNLDPEKIHIEDISVSLAVTYRFCGLNPNGITVGTHSLLVCAYLWSTTTDPEVTLQGLMHDCEEAYFHDISSPLKRLACMQEYAALAEKGRRVILTKFGISPDLSEAVHEADKLVFDIEQQMWAKVKTDTLSLQSPGVTDSTFQNIFTILTEMVKLKRLGTTDIPEYERGAKAMNEATGVFYRWAKRYGSELTNPLQVEDKEEVPVAMKALLRLLGLDGESIGEIAERIGKKQEPSTNFMDQPEE